MKEAKEYLLKIKFDDAHLPELFNDDDKSYYTIPELMESYAQQRVNEVSEERKALIEMVNYMFQYAPSPVVDEYKKVIQKIENEK